jgi:DNA-binding SARP family transcriptional activator
MLGPLEVRTGGGPGEIVEVAGARLRALLVMLALHPGQLVTASQLIDGLWPAEPPAAAATRCRPWCPGCAGPSPRRRSSSGRLAIG